MENPGYGPEKDLVPLNCANVKVTQEKYSGNCVLSKLYRNLNKIKV